VSEGGGTKHRAADRNFSAARRDRRHSHKAKKDKNSLRPEYWLFKIIRFVRGALRAMKLITSRNFGTIVLLTVAVFFLSLEFRVGVQLLICSLEQQSLPHYL
jgi:hypothetical protein